MHSNKCHTLIVTFSFLNYACKLFWILRQRSWSLGRAPCRSLFSSRLHNLFSTCVLNKLYLWWVFTRAWWGLNQLALYVPSSAWLDVEALADVEALDVEALAVEALADVEGLDVEALDVEALDVEALDVEALDVEALDVEALDVPTPASSAALSCRRPWSSNSSCRWSLLKSTYNVRLRRLYV